MVPRRWGAVAGALCIVAMVSTGCTSNRPPGTTVIDFDDYATTCRGRPVDLRDCYSNKGVSISGAAAVDFPAGQQGKMAIQGRQISMNFTTPVSWWRCASVTATRSI